MEFIYSRKKASLFRSRKSITSIFIFAFLFSHFALFTSVSFAEDTPVEPVIEASAEVLPEMLPSVKVVPSDASTNLFDDIALNDEAVVDGPARVEDLVKAKNIPVLMVEEIATPTLAKPESLANITPVLPEPVATSTEIVSETNTTHSETFSAGFTDETIELVATSTEAVVVPRPLPVLNYENLIVDLSLPENISEDILIDSVKNIEALPLRISFAQTTSTSTPVLRNEYVMYENVFSNTDVEYKITEKGLKENIILKTPEHPAEFSYNINLENYDHVIRGNILRLYKKGHVGNALYLQYIISAPYMSDAAGNRSTDIALDVIDGKLVITPSSTWLSVAAYPVIVDPTVEISVLNTHSNPIAGQDWVVDFTTVGTGDLTITPTDQATIDDDQFVSLYCGTENRTAQVQILPNDVLFYPNWNCEDVAQLTHLTLVTGNHHLLFTFSGEEETVISEAFNANRTWDGGGGDALWSNDLNWSSDTEPGVSDVAVFDGTCVSNCSPTIDTAISVLGISMNAGYGGVVTQSNTITLGSSGFVVAAGTFTGNASTITVNGAFTQTGGVFTSTSGTLNVDGNMSLTPGTFTHNSGTINFIDNDSGHNTTLSCTGTPFNLVMITKNNGSAFNINNGCTVPLGASPTIYITSASTWAGTITVASGTWTVGGGYYINITNNGTITHSGDGWNWGNNGLIQGVSAVITYAGSTMTFGKDLTITSGTFPSGKDITFTDADSGQSSTLSCTGTPFNKVIITKDNGSAFHINSGCTVPLGASPTTKISSASTWAGTVTVDSGTWTESGWNMNITNNGTITHNGSGWVWTQAGLVLGVSGVVTYAGSTMTFGKDLTITSGTFPSGKDITFLDADSGHTTTVSCTGTPFNKVIITKDNGSAFHIGAGCTIPLGASPTSSITAASIWSGTTTIASGTWTENGYGNITNNGTITHDGSGWVSAGGLTMGSSGVVTYAGSTITFMRDFNIVSGTFPSGKDVTFTTSGNSTQDTTVSCTGSPFNKVIITKTDSGSGFTVASGCTIPLGANPTSLVGSSFINNGTITISSGTWTANGAVNLANNGTITHSGNGWASQGGLIMGASGLVTYAGTAVSFFLDLNISVGTFPSGLDLTFTSAGNSTLNSTFTFPSGYSMASLTISKHNSNTMSFSGAASTTITGALTWSTTNTVNNPSTATTLIVQGSASFSSTQTFGGSNLTLSLEGGTNTTISKTAGTFASKLKINKTVGNIVTLTTALVTTNTFEINSGTFSQGATFDFTTGGATTIGSDGTWTNTGTGDVTLGGNLINAGVVTFNSNGSSCGDADSIVLSDAGTTQRTWSGTGTFTLQDLNVSDMAGSITTQSSTDTTNNTGWIFTGCNVNPDTPTSLGSAAYTNGTWGTDNTPTFTFTQSDSDVADTLRYNVQIDNTSDFSSLTIDAYSSFIAQGSSSYTSPTLPDGQYYWRVRSSDSVATSSYATANSGAIAFGIDTVNPNAGTLTLGTLTSTSITSTISGASDGGSGLAAIPYIFYNTTAGTNSLATTSLAWVSSSLSPNTLYVFFASTTDAAGNSATTTSVSTYTLATVPTSVSATVDSGTQITLSWDANSNASGTEYYAVNITASTTSGWITTTTSTVFGGLSCATAYSFEVKARNGNGVETATTTAVQATTSACPVVVLGNGNGGGSNGSPGNGGGGGVGSPPRPPAQGFSVLINNNATTTVSSQVTLKLNGGPDAVRMLISNTPQFISVQLQDYEKSVPWSLCSGICANGTYGVYVKYYTFWGAASVTVYDTIDLVYYGDTYTPPPTDKKAPLQVGLGASLDRKSYFSPLLGITTRNQVSLKADTSLQSVGKDKLKYEFDCTSDGIIDYTVSNSSQTSVTASNICTYPASGTYLAKVTTSRPGSSASKTVLVSVGNPIVPPVVPPPVIQPPATTTPPIIPPVVPPVITTPPPLVPPPVLPPILPPEITPGIPPELVIPEIVLPSLIFENSTSSFAAGMATLISSASNFVTNSAYRMSGSFARAVDLLKENKTVAQIGTISIAPVILASQYSMVSGDLLLNIKSGSDAVYALTSLLNGLLTALGIRKRRRRWGTVYDAVTKQPLDPVLVELIDVNTGKVVEESITDMFGRFGFLDRPGRYIIRAQKTNYQFPSRTVLGTRDMVFESVYHGEVFEIMSTENVIAPNIPMDQVAVDWNQLEKKRLGYGNMSIHLDVLIAKGLQFVFWAGFAVIGVMFLSEPDLVNGILTGIYIVLAVVNTYLPKPHLWGKIVSSRMSPQGLLIELRHESIPDVVIGKAITNESGKFTLKAIPGNRYIIKIKSIGDTVNTLLAERVVTVGGDGVVNDVITLD